jgi:hypothetical protein
MHFLSDTVAGVVLGGAAVALTAVVLARSPEGIRILGPRALHPNDGVGDGTSDGLEAAEIDRIAV